MIPRIVATPLAGPPVSPRDAKPRPIAADVLAAVVPGPARDRLGAGAVLTLTTGQQPGLFTGPLYTIYKALSAIALARRIERDRRVPVVPVFWVAGDDHDFAEANHAWFLNGGGDPDRITLRERPASAPQLPLWREACGPEVTAAIERLRAGTPETEFKPAVLAWLQAAYAPARSLSDAFADAIHTLLGPHGLAVFRFHDPSAKRAAAQWVVKGLPVTLPDGLTPVLVEAREGRDRLRPIDSGFVTRRSEERFSLEALREIAATAPERLSPNVLLRPVVEAALFPTVAYMAGPGELAYFGEAGPVFRALGIDPQPAVPRWSGVLVESRVDKTLQKNGLSLGDLDGAPGSLEARLVRDALPPEIATALSTVRHSVEGDYERLGSAVERLDPTLKGAVQSARNAALAHTHDIEKKLIAALKRTNDTAVGQLTRARHAVFPNGKPQERVLGYPSFALRYGPELLDALLAEVARWADAS